MSELYEKALKIATKAHEGQIRKFGDDKGKPYIIHPTRVASQLYGFAKIAAILHDVIEDTSVTKEDLLEQGIPKEVVDAVVILSRKDGETYYDFIMRMANGIQDCSEYLSYQIAIFVKVGDIKDNMISLKEGSLKDKYRLARKVLIDAL